MAERCDHIIPHWEPGLGIFLGQRTCLADYPCQLEFGHAGEHVIVNDHGQRMGWMIDYCDDCDTPDDYCGCYLYGPVGDPKITA